MSTLFLHLFWLAVYVGILYGFCIVFLCARATCCFRRLLRERKKNSVDFLDLGGISLVLITLLSLLMRDHFSSASKIVKMKQQQPKSFISLIINTLLSLGLLNVVFFAFLFFSFFSAFYIYLFSKFFVFSFYVCFFPSEFQLFVKHFSEICPKI